MRARLKERLFLKNNSNKKEARERESGGVLLEKLLSLLLRNILNGICCSSNPW